MKLKNASRVACLVIALFVFAACSSTTTPGTQNPPAETPQTPTEPSNPGTNDGSFNIVLRFPDNSLSDAQKVVFERAATRWESIITGDLANATVNFTTEEIQQCDQASTALNTTIDDLLIDVVARAIDGEGNVLAGAGPCGSRENGLPFLGAMEFDTADANDPAFESTVLHEMGHVLGIGTLWEGKGFTICDADNPGDPFYLGAKAVAAHAELGQSGSIPVANTGGRGTACGHWRESHFDTEMMTGYSDTNNDPISRMTIQALADLGYAVDVTKADAYEIPACAPTCDLNDVALQAQGRWEIIRYPVFVIDQAGILKPYK